MLKFAMTLSPIANFVRKNFFFSLLLADVFILKLHSFYFLPLASVFVTSHTAAKALILVLALICFLKYKRQFILLTTKRRILVLLVSLYLAGQTFSLIGAQDLYLFLKFYHNIVIGILIFLLSLLLYPRQIKETGLVFNSIIIMGTVLIATDAILRAFYLPLLPLLNVFIQKEFMDAILSNIEQNKFFLALGNEIFIPFFVMALIGVKSENKLKILSFFTLLALCFLSVLSNFRTRILESMVGIFASIAAARVVLKISYTFRQILVFIMIVIVFVLSMWVGLRTSTNLYSFNVLDRILLLDDTEDVQTIESRVDQYSNSLYIFTSSPYFGIGLGNYAHYVHFTQFTTFDMPDYRVQFNFQSLARPHNLLIQHLVETGIVGTIPMVLLFIYFAYTDIKAQKKKEIKKLEIAFIISSWLNIFYGLFNPADTIYVMGWFWFSRGIIEGIRIREDKNYSTLLTVNPSK